MEEGSPVASPHESHFCDPGAIWRCRDRTDNDYDQSDSVCRLATCLAISIPKPTSHKHKSVERFRGSFRAFRTLRRAPNVSFLEQIAGCGHSTRNERRMTSAMEHVRRSCPLKLSSGWENHFPGDGKCVSTPFRQSGPQEPGQGWGHRGPDHRS